jgi:hypothetical protein
MRREWTSQTVIGIAFLVLVVTGPGGITAVHALSVWDEPHRAESCEVVMEQKLTDVDQYLGDFEIVPDPSDPQSNLLLTANIGEDPLKGAKIIVARLDAQTGKPIQKQRVIANNYTGLNQVNGPEFAFHDTYGLGVLYAGPDGVHAAWRKPGERAWDAFLYDVYGVEFLDKSPPPLPGTIAGRDPGSSPPFGQTTYTEFGAFCEKHCAGNYTDATRTDLGPALRELGIELTYTTPHPSTDGYLVISACPSISGRSQGCGLFEVQVDGTGGVWADTLYRLTPSNHSIRYRSRDGIRAAIHPVTGYFVVFALRFNTLDIWESPSAHAPLALVASFSGLPQETRHTRVVEYPGGLYLHFLVKEGAGHGSYLVEFTRDTVSVPERFSQKGRGTELVYLPAADRLAFYYKQMSDDDLTQLLVRCWVQPILKQGSMNVIELSGHEENKPLTQ